MSLTLKDLKLNQRAMRDWLATLPADERVADPSAHDDCLVVRYVRSVVGEDYAIARHVLPLPGTAARVTCGIIDASVPTGGKESIIPPPVIPLPPYIIRWQKNMYSYASKRSSAAPAGHTVGAYYVTGAEAARAFRKATRNVNV